MEIRLLVRWSWDQTILDIPDGTQWNQRDPLKGKEEAEKGEPEKWDSEKDAANTDGWEDGEMGHRAREVGDLLNLEKTRKQILLLEPPEGT